jgi:hypothetical protein
MRKIKLFLYVSLIYIPTFAQVELVPPSNPVYRFLQSMQLDGILVEYNHANIPISRGEVRKFIDLLTPHREELSAVDKKTLDDLNIEFSFEENKNLTNSFSFVDGFHFNKIFENDKQKYLYYYSDENASLFIDGTANYRFRSFTGDTYDNSIHLADIGLRLRGTLFQSVGYYLNLYSGQQISGSKEDRIVAAANDVRLASTAKFLNEKYYNSFEGYLRYQTETNWLAITVGREATQIGRGYLDKMFLSSGTVPYDFLRLDLNYKAISYSFSYGNLRGDSLGRNLESKNIINHRLDVRFSPKLRIGFYEAIIASEAPFNFIYLNPISFLTSADFTAEPGGATNSIMGFDAEYIFYEGVGIQGTLFIDDIDFRDLGGDKKESNDNKFGYQFGLFWCGAFSFDDVDLIFEYTRLDPFVYSHRTNKSNYTHHGFSLGHGLAPNSDEIAVSLNYAPSHRINFNILYQFQRSGEGLEFDADGNLITNYGGNILRGDGDFLMKNTFLNGNRINRNIITLNLFVEPINQYFVSILYTRSIIKDFTSALTFNDNIFYFTVGVDF